MIQNIEPQLARNMTVTIN